MYENGYKKLQDSLIDVIAEEQAKLGYMKEPIRLYYPLSSLHHFFKSEGDAEAMQESLGGFPEATKEIFGEVQVSHKGDRFCFFLSENATEYVHEHRDENAFIFALADCMQRSPCSVMTEWIPCSLLKCILIECSGFHAA